MRLADRLIIKVDELLPRQHQLVLAALIAGLVTSVLVAAGYPQSGRHVNDIAVSNQLSSPLPTAATPDQDWPGLPEFAHPASLTPLASAAGLVIGPLTEIDPRLLLEVSPGDNLSLLFDRAGLGPGVLQEITTNQAETKKLAALNPGDKLAFSITAANTLASLEIIKSPIESFLYTRDQAGTYHYTYLEKHPDIELVHKEAVISDSLFQAAQRGDIPAALAMEFAGIFGGVVDFINDTREGDTFSLLYEQKYLEGELIGFGRILAAQFVNQGEIHTAVRYENDQGESNFFNLNGESMRKTFVLNPVDFTRISSGFSLARKHPILNTIRAHKGIDYAAPTGTQVVATADGRVTFANRKGTYGKLVVIQHGDQFETRYAHLDAFARGISSGVRVRQGQTIGYVGSTGGATGPHLHYEFLMGGLHKNPATIHEQLPRAVTLSAAEMPRFLQDTRGFLALLTSKGKLGNTLARNSHAAPEE